MATRYINADNIRKPIYAEEDNCTGIGMTFDEMDAYNEGIDAVIRQIDSVPTAEVKPVVHGEWKSAGCNKCGRTLHEIIDGDSYLDSYYEEFGTPFCPFCGADLRGE